MTAGAMGVQCTTHCINLEYCISYASGMVCRPICVPKIPVPKLLPWHMAVS